MKTRIILFLLCFLAGAPIISAQTNFVSEQWFEGEWIRDLADAKRFQKLTITHLQGNQYQIEETSYDGERQRSWVGTFERHTKTTRIIVNKKKLGDHFYNLSFRPGLKVKTNLVFNKIPVEDQKGKRGKMEKFIFQRKQYSQAMVSVNPSTGIESPSSDDETGNDEATESEYENEGEDENEETEILESSEEQGKGNLTITIIGYSERNQFLLSIDSDQYQRMVPPQMEGEKAVFKFSEVPPGSYEVKLEKHTNPNNDASIFEKVFGKIRIQLPGGEEVNLNLGNENKGDVSLFKNLQVTPGKTIALQLNFQN